jgi:DNA-binding MarR family transcriptional regulator
LLRAARQTFRVAVRDALADAGCDDMPAQGSYVVVALGQSAQMADIIGALGVSKQAAGQLVDTLAGRGYLQRDIDPDDRRRLLITLTPRGSAAAEVVRNTVDAIEADIAVEVGARSVAHARDVLSALSSWPGRERLQGTSAIVSSPPSL